MSNTQSNPAMQGANADYRQRYLNLEQAYLGLLERHIKLIDAYIARYGEALDFFQSSPRCKRPFLSVTTGKNVRAL